jgi:hypothetical protein
MSFYRPRVSPSSQPTGVTGTTAAPGSCDVEPAPIANVLFDPLPYLVTHGWPRLPFRMHGVQPVGASETLAPAAVRRG